MVLEQNIVSIIILIFILIISSLPLYFAVSLLGGRASILNSLIVMLIASVLGIVMQIIFPVFGPFIGWVLLIWAFHEIFRLKWLKAILAWILWIVFIVIFGFLLSLVGLASYLITL